MCDICGTGPVVLTCLLCPEQHALPNLARLVAHVKAVHPAQAGEFFPDGYPLYEDQTGEDIT